MGLLKSQYLPQKPVLLFNKVKTFCISHQLSRITWKYYVILSKNYLGFISVSVGKIKVLKSMRNKYCLQRVSKLKSSTVRKCSSFIHVSSEEKLQSWSQVLRI